MPEPKRSPQSLRVLSSLPLTSRRIGPYPACGSPLLLLDQRREDPPRDFSTPPAQEQR